MCKQVSTHDRRTTRSTDEGIQSARRVAYSLWHISSLSKKERTNAEEPVGEKSEGKLCIGTEVGARFVFSNITE